MNKLFSRMLSPTTLLYVFVVFTQLIIGIYLAGEFDPPPAFTLLYPPGFLWVVGWWMLGDSRRRGVEWVFDMGLFLYIAWPFVMPYYLLKTRGAKGLFVILGFVGVYAGALIAGTTLSLMFGPQRN
jgi:hypothetical protein